MLNIGSKFRCETSVQFPVDATQMCASTFCFSLQPDESVMNLTVHASWQCIFSSLNGQEMDRPLRMVVVHILDSLKYTSALECICTISQPQSPNNGKSPFYTMTRNYWPNESMLCSLFIYYFIVSLYGSARFRKCNKEIAFIFGLKAANSLFAIL